METGWPNSLTTERNSRRGSGHHQPHDLRQLTGSPRLSLLCKMKPSFFFPCRVHSCEAVTCVPGSLFVMFCHYQNQEEKAPGKRALGTKESSCREPPFENLPISQCVQKDSTSGDVCNESNRIQVSCGLPNLKSLGGLQKLPVWHLASCVITPLPWREAMVVKVSAWHTHLVRQLLWIS